MKHEKAIRFPGNRGAMLVELTCALFVVTVAGFGAIQMFSIGLSKIGMMREYDVATEVLRNELEWIRALPYAEIASSDTFASSTPALETLHEPETRVAVTEGELPGLKEVTVTLRWRSRETRTIERSLTTLVADLSAGRTG